MFGWEDGAQLALAADGPGVQAGRRPHVDHEAVRQYHVALGPASDAEGFTSGREPDVTGFDVGEVLTHDGGSGEQARGLCELRFVLGEQKWNVTVREEKNGGKFLEQGGEVVVVRAHRLRGVGSSEQRLPKVRERCLE
jgi:hypothetical protein